MQSVSSHPLIEREREGKEEVKHQTKVHNLNKDGNELIKYYSRLFNSQQLIHVIILLITGSEALSRDTSLPSLWSENQPT